MVTSWEKGSWRNCFHNTTVSGHTATWSCQTHRDIWEKKGKKEASQKALQKAIS